jgi:hypothetical protein
MKALYLLVVCTILCLCGIAESGELRFAVLQPGQPGSPNEAQSVMDAFGAYLKKRLNTGAIEGRYENELQEALDHVRDSRPRWGIVSLPFYVRYAEALRMVPLASTRPKGGDKDVWRLMVSRGAVADWKSLQGSVLGTMLFVPDSAACLMFRLASNQLPMHLEGTSQPLMALRKLTKEKAAGAKVSGVVLDRPQFEALKSLPMMDQLQEIHQSPKLPTSPVVAFGPADQVVERLVRVLMDMRKDKEGLAVLEALQTDGFGPPDNALEGLRVQSEDQNVRCAP